MRWRPCAAGAKQQGERTSRTPPLPDNPYRRFYTRTPTFEELVRRSREGYRSRPDAPDAQKK